MKPLIVKTSQASTDQSVICIMGGNKLPDNLNLTGSEKEFALKGLVSKEDCIFINSYTRCIYLIPVKEGISGYKVREELRKSAANMKKLIKDNNHKELVITSENTYKGAIEDFVEGLILSFYSFDKYKTKTPDEQKKSYPNKLLLQGDISDSDIKWLDELTNAVYFARDLINEPVNHLNATGSGR